MVILKGTFGFAFAAIVGVLNFLWWIGAIRLAEPNSPWARRCYVGDREPKLEESIRRHSNP